MFGIVLLCILIVIIGISVNGIWPYLFLFGFVFVVNLIIIKKWRR